MGEAIQTVKTGLQGIDGLVSLIERCFRISLFKHEGQPLRFALAVSRGHAILSSEELLSPPARASVENLRRLAVAVDAHGSCLHVSIDASDGSAMHAPRPRRK